MSEQEMNSYRFMSGMEPGDERLAKIMEEVTHDAMARREKAESYIKKDLNLKRISLHERWSDRINRAVNG